MKTEKAKSPGILHQLPPRHAFFANEEKSNTSQTRKQRSREVPCVSVPSSETLTNTVSSHLQWGVSHVRTCLHMLCACVWLCIRYCMCTHTWECTSYASMCVVLSYCKGEQYTSLAQRPFWPPALSISHLQGYRGQLALSTTLVPSLRTPICAQDGQSMGRALLCLVFLSLFFTVSCFP